MTIKYTHTFKIAINITSSYDDNFAPGLKTPEEFLVYINGVKKNRHRSGWVPFTGAHTSIQSGILVDVHDKIVEEHSSGRAFMNGLKKDKVMVHTFNIEPSDANWMFKLVCTMKGTFNKSSGLVTAVVDVYPNLDDVERIGSINKEIDAIWEVD